MVKGQAEGQRMGGRGSGQIRNGDIMKAPVCRMKESRFMCVCSSKTLLWTLKWEFL